MRRSGIDLALIFVVLVWGTSPVVLTIVVTHVQPLAFVMVRFALLSVLAVGLLAVRWARGGRAWRIRRRDVPLLIVSGLAGFGIYQTAYILGLAHTTAFASALIIAMLPLFSAIILVAARVERIAVGQWTGVGLALAGLAAFLTFGAARGGAEIAGHRLTAGDMLLGDALLLVATALFAVYGIVNKRLAAHYSPPELMCYTILIGTVALLPAGIPAALAQNWPAVTWPIWLAIGYSVIFPVYVTYSIWNWAIGRLGVGYVTLFTYPVPVVAGIVAWFVLGQALTWPQAAAAAVVLAGMLVARWAATRAYVPPPAPAPPTDIPPVPIADTPQPAATPN